MFLMALGLVESSNGELPETPVNSLDNNTQKTLATPNNAINGNTHEGTNLVDSFWNLLGNVLANQCRQTHSLQHLYYQIGCGFFLLGFIAPSNLSGVLYMRCMLIIGCILFVMWSYLIECRPDVIIWSGLFILANFIHMAILICKLRPVKFDKEIEAVSNNI